MIHMWNAGIKCDPISKANKWDGQHRREEQGLADRTDLLFAASVIKFVRVCCWELTNLIAGFTDRVRDC
jgi:hypothetical protein